MSTSIHPSSEELSAYFDEELSPQQSSTIETHLNQCPGCQSLVDEFGTMAELGPLVEESLPGPAYWADLPDRILVRVANADSVGPVPVQPHRSLWQRLWDPQGSWKWAVGTVASLVLVAGVWFGLGKQPNPEFPVDRGIAEEIGSPNSDPGIKHLEELASDSYYEHLRESPESFTQRVMATLGSEENPGESLDILPEEPRMRQSAVSPPIGTQVSNDFSPLHPQTRAKADPVVTYGCGENWAEQAFLAAMKAEESGDPFLAAQGYRVVRSHVAPTHPLYAEAHFRLNYLLWQRRMHELAGIQRAQLLDRLNRVANQRFASWEKTQGAKDCREAWCMNRVLLTLSGDVAAEPQLEQTSDRMTQLKNCLSQ